tara:strand:- start:499 stop:1284 length:786 start_codon:yes stop_codon:yes gene_type:complete
MLSLNRFNKADELADPFPLLIIDNFLNKDETKNAISFLNTSSFDETVNEGRKNIRMGTKNFDHVTKNEGILSDIHDFFNKKKTYDFLYEKLLNISKYSKNKSIADQIPANFEKEYYEYKREIHKSNYKKRFSNFLNTKIPLIEKLRKKFFFLEMNYAIATKGYKLPTHTDKKTRIIVFLLYLNDLNEDSGGALEVYSKINSKSKDMNEKFFLEKKFQPESGKLIIFLSNPISYHNVGNIFDESKRYFCYGSYTSNKDIIWT